VTGRLLTTRELADQVGVTPETILRYVRAGELRGIRLPGTVRGRLRFDPASIDAWLAEHSTAAPAREAPATQTGTAAQRLSSLAPATSPVGRATTEEVP
jgi:excisionase family DNA binding protein